MELKQPPPTLPGFEPVATVHELPPPPPRQRRSAVKPPEQPAPDDVTASLLTALDRVHSVVTARIAWHEAQLRQLREALKPFAGIPQASGAPMSDGDLAQELLKLAKQLPGMDDTTPSD